LPYTISGTHWFLGANSSLYEAGRIALLGTAAEVLEAIATPGSDHPIMYPGLALIISNEPVLLGMLGFASICAMLLETLSTSTSSVIRNAISRSPRQSRGSQDLEWEKAFTLYKGIITQSP